MKINNVILAFEPYYERILPTGSRVIMSKEAQEITPPNDEDYLILVTPGNRVLIEARLQQEGWELGGSLPNQGPLQGDWNLNTEHTYTPEGVIDMHFVFHSWKRAEVPGFWNGPPEDIVTEFVDPSGPELNLLVTCNERYFDDFTRATFLSRALNLTEKQDRVLVFDALTRDVWPHAETHRKKKRNKYISSTLSLQPGAINAIPPGWIWLDGVATETAIAAPPILPDWTPAVGGIANLTW